MTLGELLQNSVFVGLLVLAGLLLVGAIRFRPGRTPERTWRQRLRKLGRHTLVRLPVAIGFALAIFVLGAAALTLNSHRPPGDNSPLVALPARSGDANVEVKLADCEGGAAVTVVATGEPRGRPRPARIISDQDGMVRFPMSVYGSSPGPTTAKGSFVISDPLARRGLLSCYLQLPVVAGTRSGYTVYLNLAEDMEVDTQSSVPAPDSYTGGEWIWSCPAGKRCPGFAAINYALEDGAKQVIVLVLAAVFGALIALLTGEVLINWARRRFNKPDPGN